MSLSATFPDRAPQPRAESPTLLLIVWGATVTTYLFTVPAGGPDYSTDDAMRLVQVRDLLAGQSWFDLTQYRLSPPEGVVTHWSRLIDLPIAALLRTAGLVAPPALAERIAAAVWPAGLLLLYLAGVMRLARGLAGDAAARLALLFTAVTAAVLQHFRPGALDHHNAQLVLLVWTLALVLRNPGDRAGAMAAGLTAALSLAIGLEMAPAIAALAGMMALRWIVEGDAAKPATRSFALALAGATFGLFVATVPTARYGEAACDALSIVHVLVAAIGGGGLALLATVPSLTTLGLATLWRRLAGATVLGALVIAVVALGFPACLGDPYGQLDPRLAELWLANVSEARSVVLLLRDLPQEVPAHYGLPAAALALGLWCALRAPTEERWRWLIGTAVLAALTMVALWQVRGAAAANAVAVALGPAALARLFPAAEGKAGFLGLGRAALIAALLINPLALIAIGSAGARAVELASGATRPTVIADGLGTCRRAADYAALKRLPAGLVLGFIDAGPFVLMETPHAVLAAPYHRNIRGNAAMLDVFLGPPDATRFKALGIDYVAFCPGAPERYNYVAAAPAGLAASLSRGEVPKFLERVELDGTELAIYRPRP